MRLDNLIIITKYYMFLVSDMLLVMQIQCCLFMKRLVVFTGVYLTYRLDIENHVVR
jgi:hypothetical protein